MGIGSVGGSWRRRRFFLAYWFCAKDQDEPIEDHIVRHIAGTFFKLD